METNIEINKPSPKFQDVSIAPMHTAEHLLNATMVKPLAARVLAMPTSKEKEQM